jgi:hypothetical protein
MAAYTVTHKQLTDNYAVLGLLTATELEVGGSIVVTGVDATFNGTYTVYALPQYLLIGVDDEGDLLYDYSVLLTNQVLYAKTAATVERQAASGTVTYTPTCTWVSTQELTNYLNITVASATDTVLIGQARAAANQFCWRRRYEAGYTAESLTTVPSADVKLGVLMYGAALYRARGSSGDTYATFDGMGTPTVVAMPGMVKQLLGIDRPAIA